MKNEHARAGVLLSTHLYKVKIKNALDPGVASPYVAARSYLGSGDMPRFVIDFDVSGPEFGPDEATRDARIREIVLDVLERLEAGNRGMMPGVNGHWGIEPPPASLS
jgi:hypothetical protein